MSSSSFGVTVAKIFLVLVNLLFAMMAYLFFLAWRMSNGTIPDHTLLYSTLTWATLSASLLVIGIALSTVSLFGLLAVLARSHSLHTLYAHLLTLWLILLGNLFFSALLLENPISSKSRAIFSQLMGNVKTKSDALQAIQIWQSTFHCCGLDGPENWNKTLNWNSNLQLYPSSCCGLVTFWSNASITTNMTWTRDRLLYREGCFSPSLLSLYKLSFIAFFTILFLVLLLLISVSCCLKRELALVSAAKRNTEVMARPLLTCPHLASPARLSAVDEAYEANILIDSPPPYGSIVFVESDQDRTQALARTHR